MAKVTVQTLPDYTYTVLVNDGEHAFASDESKEDGGDDLGPSPYELLLASLGSCTAITLVMYARRKQWKLYEIGLSLSQEKVSDPGAERPIDEIRVDIAVRGELDAEQTQRLLEIAERCPVHRTLLSTPRIVSTISGGP